MVRSQSSFLQSITYLAVFLTVSAANSVVSASSGVVSVDMGGSAVNGRLAAGATAVGSVNGGGSEFPVHLGSGASYSEANDFSLSMNGISWTHRRIYSSLTPSVLSWQGEKWWSNEMSNITVAGTDGASDVTWQLSPNDSYTFTYNTGGGVYNEPNDNFPFTITFVSGSDEYQIRRVDGALWVYHDAGATNAGKIKRLEDVFGNDLAFTYTSGQLTDIVADVVEGSDHKIAYTYFSSGDNSGKLQYIKVYKTTTTTDANLIGKVEYVYHDSGTDTYGITGNLMKVIVTEKATNDGDGTLSIENTTYYRYWKGTYNSSTNPGTDHQLRYILFAENADRLGSPETKTNTQWESYTNVLYEYDSNGRVRKTEDRLPGSGCGCGGGGGAGTTTYTWTVSSGTPNLDTWKLHCVADREDSTRVIFDMNRLYQPLTWVVQNENDGTPTREMIWHFDYGTSGASENRLTQIHYPSVCSDYDESTYAVTLRSSAGLVYEVDYDYATDTYDGYPERIRIKQGTSGTAETLKAYGRTITERPDLATSIIEYESAGETNGRTTSLSYSFYDGAKYQIKQIDTTYPSVSAAKNGPDASAVEKQYFDKRTGALRWTLDGEGYVNFHAYDIETGVETLSVIDANTSSLLTAIDDGWDGVTHGGLGADDTVPFSRTGTGTALDIDSSSVVDWLGRTRKTIDAGGMITWTVYKDDEVRSYPAFNGTDTLLPIEITKYDKDGRGEESLTLKAGFDPALTSSAPNGTETYANTDMSTRTVTTYNDSGAVSTVDRYHSIPTSGNGTRYTNYYRTTTEYDSMGRVEYTIEDVAKTAATGPPVKYDTEQVTQHFFDYVGRSIKTSQAVSTDDHDIAGGKPTMKTLSETFYDDPDSDATPEQGDGDGNVRWTRAYHGTGGSDYNNTEYRYDWRNRRCLTIPPLPPYSLVAYDHLDRVTTSASYSATTNLDPGDDPATTENTIRLSLSKSYFDEWGRVYKTESYDDPADATPADELASVTYYDRRGQVWASDPANSGISFTKYDGARRQIQTFEGIQFDSAKFTSSAPDYPDDDEGIIHLVDYTVNDDGNVIKTISRELNHNDTLGMDLTNNDNYIRTYVYSYYDAAHRLTDTVNFGTNNSDTPRRWKDNSTAPTYDNNGGVAGDQPPDRSDDALVTSYSYNADGHQETVTDPMGINSKSVYDALGQVVAKIEDDAGSTTKRKTEYQFNAQGSLVRIMHDPGVDNTFADGVWTLVGSDTDQVTEYAYTDSTSARWVKEIRYPTGDGTVGSSATDKIVFTYNVDGTLATRTDQNSTVLTWSYDASRRKTEEEVTTLGTYTGGAGAVDGAIRAFTWVYDEEGHVTYATAHTDTTPDTSTWTDAANQVKYTYNAAHQLTKEEQEEDGMVDGSTLSVQYGYGTDYGSKYYNRRDSVTLPDSRKIWNYYTPASSPSFPEKVADAYNRVIRLKRDNSGSAGDTLVEYEFNGLGRVVRRVHDEDTGKYGNDTRMDLWHGTSGQYDGLDRFGRVKDLKHTDFNGTATDFLQRKYGYDRNGNRTYIDDPLWKADSQSFTYDNLNRLTEGKRGLLNSSSAVQLSDVKEGLNMDLLGSFTPTVGGVKVNSTSSTITHAINATNEITTLDTPNPSGAPTVINEPFTTSLSSFWSQNKGTWAISSDKASVSTLTSGEALLLADPDLDIVNYEFDVTFPTGTSTNKAGMVFAHDGNNSYYAVVLNRSTAKIAVYQVTNGTWSAALASANASVSNNVAYTIQVQRKLGSIEVFKVGQASATFTYDPSTDFGVGQAGVYSDATGVTFDNFRVSIGYVRDPQVLRLKGNNKAGLVDQVLSIAQSRGVLNKQYGVAAVEGFSDDYFMVQADVDAGIMTTQSAEIWVRHLDANNGYRISCKGDSGGARAPSKSKEGFASKSDVDKDWASNRPHFEFPFLYTGLVPNVATKAALVKLGYAGNNTIELAKVVDGKATTLAANNFVTDGTAAVKVKIYNDSGSHRFKIWVDGTLAINTTDSTIPAGGVAFAGYDAKFDNCKIGYDVTNDDDIDDPTDDLIWNESWGGGTSKTLTYDHAGNMIEDGTFRYIYDAWNRLVSVKAAEDSGAVTIQASEFDATGRRIKKTITNAGDYDKTEVYYHDGQRICQINNGSGAMVQQFIHGTQYIDEVVMMRVKDKGDLYLHQDANWNVIGTTDLGRHVVERNVYTPYGELTVHQDTGFGDRDGDQDVDSTDKGTVGTTCTGTVTGFCRILDLDFDGDYDSTDATKFDSLTQGAQRRPGRPTTATSQPFAHQGLFFEPELAQYQNRARQYDPGKRRFAQRDPLGLTQLGGGGYHDGMSQFNYIASNPLVHVDPSGEGLIASIACRFLGLGIEGACNAYCNSQGISPKRPDRKDRCMDRCMNQGGPKVLDAIVTLCSML